MGLVNTSEKRMSKFENYVNKKYVMSGELFVAHQPTILWADLGSCISIILHHPEKKISGMLHAMLPSDARNGICRDSCPAPCNMHPNTNNELIYISCSFKNLLKKFHDLDIKNSDLQVSIIGGATIFDVKIHGESVSDRNIEFARKIIKAHRLKIIMEDLGGSFSRRIFHYSDVGTTEIIKQSNRFAKK